MNQHAEPQGQSLAALYNDPALLSLRKRIPPERVGHQEPVVSGMEPGAAEVPWIGHEHDPDASARIVAPVGLPAPDLPLVLAPVAIGDHAAVGDGQVGRHPYAQSHLLLVAEGEVFGTAELRLPDNQVAVR